MGRAVGRRAKLFNGAKPRSFLKSVPCEINLAPSAALQGQQGGTSSRVQAQTRAHAHAHNYLKWCDSDVVTSGDTGEQLSSCKVAAVQRAVVDRTSRSFFLAHFSKGGRS